MPSSRSIPPLPAGFRFHPTDEELMVHYLMNQAASIPCPVPIIAEVNIYHCNPWDLPAKAVFGENEWYFFSPRDRKYPNGARPNRAAGSGYWKATGTDKTILSTPTGERIGVKKALLFYKGKPPRGLKTDWIMHEYRLTAGDNKSTERRGSSMRLDDWVLCRIHKKSNDFHQVSDQEQEGSSIVEEESHLVSSTNTTASASSQKSGPHAGYDDQFQFPCMSKSWSLTDLFNTVDYSALFLDGALVETDEPQQQIPLIFPTHENQAANNSYYINCQVNNNSTNMSHVDPSDYSSSGNYNGLKRKRIMTLDGAPASSFDDGSSFSKKLQQLPTDSSSWLY